MAHVMDYATYLAKEIGPRPAGTEEEQQAALYITEQLQKETGFTANMEEFSSSTNYEAGRAVLALVTIVATILAMIFPVLVIPAFILAAAAAAVYALEEMDRPIISRVLSHGASQNVVAKYQPNYEEPTDSTRQSSKPAPRSRKIVLIAHYDTGRVVPPLVQRAQSTKLPFALVCVIAMIVSAFFLLIRIFVAPGGGMGLLVLNVLSIISIIVCALPPVKALLMRGAAYNEGANNNATGTAALIEVARRISRGSVSEADLAQNAPDGLRIHGEAAAREAGLVPEGAQIRYEAEQLLPPSELGEHDEEERLLAAKAAIAAMTGKPVERRVYGSVADKLVNSRVDSEDLVYVGPGEQAPAGFAAPDEATVSESADSASGQDEAEGFQNAPSWFIAAQRNAKRSGDDSAAVAVQRSKYTEAMENAERAQAERVAEALAAEQAQIEAEQRAREAEARAAIDSANLSGIPARAGENSGNAENIPTETPAVSDVNPTASNKESLRYADPAAADASADPVEHPFESEPLSSQSAKRGPAIDLPAVRQPVVHDRIANLPAIDPASSASSDSAAPAATPAPVTSPSRSGMLRRLRNNVPSLSGLIDPVSDRRQSQQQPQRRQPQPSVAEPVDYNMEVPVAQAAPVDSAAVPANGHPASRASASRPSSANVLQSTDSQQGLAPQPTAIQQNAGHSSSDMNIPRTRSGNILGRLRGSGKEDLADTPQQWLDVDDDFEARRVGRDRGSWESFRDDDLFGDDDDTFDDFGTGDDNRTGRRWQGGAYTRMQLGHVNMRSGSESEADTIIPDEPPEVEDNRQLTGEIEQIYHFRNPQFSTEIWFVALGADGDGHDGARAFLEAHASELRGAMMIEIESLGAGELSVATEEGRVRKLAASSRVKRFTRAATSVTGIAPGEVSLLGFDSISSVIQRAGFQTMHLFGAEGGRIALKGSPDDILENIDELLFDDHVNYVFELLKQ